MRRCGPLGLTVVRVSSLSCRSSTIQCQRRTVVLCANATDRQSNAKRFLGAAAEHNLWPTRRWYSSAGQQQRQEKEEQEEQGGGQRQEGQSGQDGGGRKGFLDRLVANIREEMERNKELQESKRELDAKLKELNETDALKDARRKYDVVEKESLKSSEILSKKLEELREQMSKAVGEIGKTVGKSEAGESVLKAAREATETVEKAAKAVGESKVYKETIKQMKEIAHDLDKATSEKMYRKPVKLQFRKDLTRKFSANRALQPNTEETGMELHKDSEWEAGWKTLKESSFTYNKIVDWKMRFNESDHPFVRIVRDAGLQFMDNFKQQNDVSRALGAIMVLHPDFNPDEWLKFCQHLVIPNVLEAMIHRRMDILKDWCYERAFMQISIPLEEDHKLGYSSQASYVMQVGEVELMGGKLMEQGPVLIISFPVTMVDVVTNAEGKVVKGDPDSAVMMNHIWVLCRDLEEMMPNEAWRVLEMHSQKGQLMI